MTAEGKLEPFPRERFLKFSSALRIQSRDSGVVPFVMLGNYGDTITVTVHLILGWLKTLTSIDALSPQFEPRCWFLG